MWRSGASFEIRARLEDQVTALHHFVASFKILINARGSGRPLFITSWHPCLRTSDLISPSGVAINRRLRGDDRPKGLRRGLGGGRHYEDAIGNLFIQP